MRGLSLCWVWYWCLGLDSFVFGLKFVGSDLALCVSWYGCLLCCVLNVGWFLGGVCCLPGSCVRFEVESCFCMFVIVFVVGWLHGF